MIRLISRVGNTIHESDSIHERAEGERLHEYVAAPTPSGQSAEGTLDGNVGQTLGHTLTPAGVSVEDSAACPPRRRLPRRRTATISATTLTAISSGVSA